MTDWWNETKAEQPGESKGLPVGKYLAEITDLTLGYWDDGTPRVEWTFCVLEGEHEGRTTYMTDGTGEKHRARTKGHLEAVGCTGDTFLDVVAKFPRAVGLRVKIARAEYNGKIYTHFNGLAEQAPDTAEQDTAAPVAAPQTAVQPPRQPELAGTRSSGVPF